MAIPREQMRLRYGNIALDQRGLIVGWEVYHAATQTVIESGTVNVGIAKPSDYSIAWTEALNLIAGGAAVVYAKHAAHSAIDGYSLFDADLILDSWLSDPINHTLTHPICGTFDGIVYDGITQLVNVILDKVAGPPIWFWARPVSGGIEVKSTGVPGATVYYLFDGTTLLGNVQGTGWNTILVADGNYNVRLAGVVGGQIGICSFPINVTVGAIVTPAKSEAMSTRSRDKTQGGFGPSLARWFRDPFGVLPNDS